jgi:hypothetical protein
MPKDKLPEQYEQWKQPLLEGKIYVPYCEKVNRKGMIIILLKHNLVDYETPPPGHGYIERRKAIDYNGKKTIVNFFEAVEL